MAERAIQRALITGIAGSGGSYLAEFILKHQPDVQVHGICRWHSTTSAENLSQIRDRITVHQADLMDLGSVISVLRQVQPDVVFHLAAMANVRESFKTPHSVLSNNILGTSNLLEAIRIVELQPIVQICSTSEVYGQVDPSDVPIREETPFRPASPYAVSKAAQDLLGWSYFVSYQMRIIRTRMFTYLNPRRTDLFATSFARQVAWIERGLQQELRHGNLESVRTIIDVRDAMRAYWDAILHCQPGEAYNIGATVPSKVGDVLDMLIAMSETPIPTRLDPELLRPADVTLQVPCIDKFVDQTGWQPEFTLEQSLADLLNHWRREADKVVLLASSNPAG